MSTTWVDSQSAACARAAVSAIESWLTSTAATRAPRRTASRATARPIPLPAPVTTRTLSATRCQPPRQRRRPPVALTRTVDLPAPTPSRIRGQGNDPCKSSRSSRPPRPRPRPSPATPGSIPSSAARRRPGSGSSVVRFAPGARNAWHAHAVGQTLHVIRGHRPASQARGGDVIEVRPGDTIQTPPGEWHWHGAAPDRFMTHLTIYEASDDGSGDRVGRARDRGRVRAPRRRGTPR